MGVLGLQTFMEQQNLVLDANIGQLARCFRMTHNITPILLIDVSVFSHIYGLTSVDGELKEYIFILDTFFKNFNNCGIKYVIFSDAYPPTHRIEIWKERREQECLEAMEVMTNLNAEYSDQISLNGGAGIWFTTLNYIRSHNIELIQTVHEADDEIIDYVNKHNCFGILAQDSDFIIAKGVRHYFSMQHLNIDTLQTIEYRSDMLARRLSLRIDMLPLFATLSGNDVVRANDLRNFHIKLLRNERNFERFANNPFFPKWMLFPKIARWINQNSVNCNLMADLKRVASMIDLDQLSDKFEASIKSYFPTIEPRAPIYSLTNNDAWNQILMATSHKMRHFYQYSRINCVITLQIFFNSVNLEFYSNPSYPCDGFICKTLRHRFYGILLKEHPNWETIQVTEYVLYNMDIEWPQKVSPIFPPNHPGLLNMWQNDEPTKEKWNLMIWLVGGGVALDKLLALPEPLQIPTLALYYITHEFPNLLKDWQISALILQAVLGLKMKAQELEIGDFEKINLNIAQPVLIDEVALHLSTIYQMTIIMICTAADACGNPTCLFKFKDHVMFDGKLFHSFFSSLKINEKLRNIDANEINCHQQMLNIIKS